MKNYLVTGGAGFIGTHLVKSLLDNSNKVSIIDNFKRSIPERIKQFEQNPNFQAHNCDIRDINQIKPLFKGIDCVYHLAAINGTENFYKIPIEIMNVGIDGIRNVLEASNYYNVPNIIAASSAEVYQTPLIIPTDESVGLSIPDIKNPRFSYGLSKIITESYCVNYDFANESKVKIFRPHNIYGPDMGFKHVIPQFIKKLLEIKNDNNPKFISQGSLEATRAFCYVSDLINGLFVLEKSENTKEIFHIGTNDEIKISNLVDQLAEILDVQLSSKETLDNHEGGTLRRCPDISKIASLGYEPKISISEGLEKTCSWYLDSKPSSNELL